jgi:hypothetical protein
MLFSLFRIPAHWVIIIGQTSTKVKENNRKEALSPLSLYKNVPLERLIQRNNYILVIFTFTIIYFTAICFKAVSVFDKISQNDVSLKPAEHCRMKNKHHINQ